MLYTAGRVRCVGVGGGGLCCVHMGEVLCMCVGRVVFMCTWKLECCIVGSLRVLYQLCMKV